MKLAEFLTIEGRESLAKELTKEGLIKILQKKMFEKILVKKVSNQ